MAKHFKCAECGRILRDDKKGITRWMAMALHAFYVQDKNYPNVPAHASTLTRNTEANRDHGVALLRHWRLLQPVEKPKNASKGQSGSRGLSGFYIITQQGRNFVEGLIQIPKNVVKPIEGEWSMQGRLVSFQEVLEESRLKVKQGIVVNGETV